ncbi:MAG: hypothetical protein ACI9NY_000506 [Kiritimatiellia bacterium]|jgi:hypothetical protein
MRSRLHRTVTALIQSSMAYIVIVPLAFSQEKAAIYVGPFDVVPEVGIDVQRDDNIFNDTSGNEVASTLTLVKPAITAVADDGVVKYTVGYQLENGSYSDVNDNDYTDHTLEAKMDWRIDVRHLIELNTSVNTGHEDRSTDSVTTFDAAADLNEFTNRALGAKYTFGSEGARGRITLGFDTNSLRYTTNQAVTNVLESDTDTKIIGLSLAFSPSSRVNFQLEESENTFRENSSRNRKDRSYTVGAEWDLTGTTKGIVSLGRTNNDLINAVGDTASSTGEIALEWSPQDHSVFTLAADKSAKNSENNTGDFIDASVFSVNWAYKFRDPLTINLSVQQQNDNYVGVNRNDTTEALQLTLTYAMRRWLTFGLSVGVEERESTDAAVTYRKDTVKFSLNASL